MNDRTSKLKIKWRKKQNSLDCSNGLETYPQDLHPKYNLAICYYMLAFKTELYNTNALTKALTKLVIV